METLISGSGLIRWRGKLSWSDVTIAGEVDVKSINELAGKHEGEICYIVGKGISLSYITKDYFQEGVVLTLNQAIDLIEPLELSNKIYSMQKDHIVSPDTKYPILIHKFESVDEIGELDNDFYLFDNTEFGLRWSNPSIMTAIKISQLMGCKKNKMISFDALTHGDTRNTMGKAWDDYKVYRRFAGDLLNGVEWITPKERR